jgi:hypothetical protein
MPGFWMVAAEKAALLDQIVDRDQRRNHGELAEGRWWQEPCQHEKGHRLAEYADRLGREKDRAATLGPAPDVLDQVLGGKRGLR